jgi:alkaline phosphatase
VTPLYTLIDQQGWKRGLVTTTEITHATPAGFATSMASRDNAPEIASQYLQGQVDVLLGGGRKFFTPEGRKDKRDLNAEFAAAGYLVITNCKELALAQTDRPWLGTFADSHLPYTIDWLADPALQRRVPHLAAMTRRALEWFGQHDHFILQVEGGRVDHGAHNCDAPATLRDLLAFDEALEVALEFQKQRPDTLVVVTTDHGNGNMGVNGSGSGYLQSSILFRNVAETKASFGEILRQVKAAPGQSASGTKVASAKGIQEILAATTGYRASDKRATLFQSFLAKETNCLYDGMNSETAQLGQLLANHYAVGWVGGAHTADYVPVTAMGPGSERFSGYIQNTEVFRNYTSLASIDFRNPEEPLIASAGREAMEVENVAEYTLV